MSKYNRYLEKIAVKAFVDDFIYRIDLDADYQREKIWSTKEQELLINSIISEIDIPKMYLAEVENNAQFDFECIDGKQRMSTLLRYYKPEPDEKKPLMVEVLGQKYTYKRLVKEHPTIAKKIDNYELHVIIYRKLSEELVREIFIRLQLGRRLNSGEMLKARMGGVRDFIFVEIGNEGPFLKNTKLSVNRFSREFTLAQICINSFSKKETGEFTRARLTDLENFFEDKRFLSVKDENFVRIKKVLQIMNKAFDERAKAISSRAVAVSCYLFCEELCEKDKEDKIKQFSEFLEKLLEVIKLNMSMLAKYEKPHNTIVLDDFQRYILQASVESYSIERRHNFLSMAFNNFVKKGKIIGE